MSKKDVLSKLNRPVDRRNFLKACGVLGVGTVAGGILQSRLSLSISSRFGTCMMAIC